MNNRTVIEDFTQYLNHCKKQLEKTPLDDIGAWRDLENDIKRYEMAIAALEEQDRHKWTSISSPPEDDEDKLIKVKDSEGEYYYFVDYYRSDIKAWDSCIYGFLPDEFEVIEWQPLPEPYKGEKK